MKLFKRYLILCILIIFTGAGAALTLKAAIGVGAWDALAQTISDFTKVKVGTIGMILNCSCVVGEMLILRKDFKISQILQIPVSILLGSVVNIFLYDILGCIQLNNYFIRLATLVIAYVFIAFSVGAVVTMDIVSFALEGLCTAISKKTKIDFAKLRQGADVISIIIVIIMIYSFSLPFSFREGTIIGMLIYGPIMGIFIKRFQVWFKKLDLID